jgi:hypothetical protein
VNGGRNFQNVLDNIISQVYSQINMSPEAGQEGFSFSNTISGIRQFAERVRNGPSEALAMAFGGSATFDFALSLGKYVSDGDPARAAVHCASDMTMLVAARDLLSLRDQTGQITRRVAAITGGLGGVLGTGIAHFGEPEKVPIAAAIAALGLGMTAIIGKSLDKVNN